MTETERINHLHRCHPNRRDRHVPRMPSSHALTLRLLKAIVTLSLIAPMGACYAHAAYDPRPQTIPHQGEVRVLTLRGEVFMLRTADVHGDTLTGDRIFCKSGWGYDEAWCKGVRPFSADSARISIPIGDIKKAQTRSFSAGRTVPLVVGMTAGLASGILLIIGLTQAVQF